MLIAAAVVVGDGGGGVVIVVGGGWVGGGSIYKNHQDAVACIKTNTAIWILTDKKRPQISD